MQKTQVLPCQPSQIIFMDQHCYARTGSDSLILVKGNLKATLYKNIILVFVATVWGTATYKLVMVIDHVLITHCRDVQRLG